VSRGWITLTMLDLGLPVRWNELISRTISQVLARTGITHHVEKHAGERASNMILEKGRAKESKEMEVARENDHQHKSRVWYENNVQRTCDI
jgi:hypothetical protein